VDETDKKKLKARVMMTAMLSGLQEIAKEDPNVQAQLKGWDRVIQYSVGGDGPHVHLVIQGGSVQPVIGAHASPAATIKFADVDTAVSVFTRKLDAQAAFMQGKVQLLGNVADAMKMGMITQLAQAYFS
jgi:putative sterol carrier protein